MFVFAPIVEGHGEVESVRVLVGRIWQFLERTDWPSVLEPIRQSKGKLLRQEQLRRAVQLAALKG